MTLKAYQVAVCDRCGGRQNVGLGFSKTEARQELTRSGWQLRVRTHRKRDGTRSRQYRDLCCGCANKEDSQ